MLYTTKPKGFDLLETIVCMFDKNWQDHADDSWSMYTAVNMEYGQGKYYRLVVIEEDGKEIGAVLQWSDEGGVSELGYNAEPFESFNDAFFALSVCILGEEELKKYLS